ncbi:septal ring lytic transglycosylase RlpA family protein [Pasteurella sp. PK-2025]|uniref:septal ring lytic transglycosylase RlpA family protein n=1 Tax=unclassified Pasteurella TaxID=2621516 RepID=UPI003C7605C8
MKIQKTYLKLTALLMMLLATSSYAETKRLYGVKGPKLAYSQPVKQSETYVVKGITYSTTPHDKAKSYSREGIASFYHKKFNGRKTANGEIYNENLYTSAHKTLPMNSYALVTNLHNNRKVIVKINDRGPFVKGRIIDLSHAAAGELGVVHHGLSKVRVEALHVNKQGKLTGAATHTLSKIAKNDEALNKLVLGSQDHSHGEMPNSSGDKGDVHYKLRAMDISSKKQAERLISALSHHNVQAEIKQKGKKYDIYFGPFKEKTDVDNLKAGLRKLNYSKPVIMYSFSN